MVSWLTSRTPSRRTAADLFGAQIGAEKILDELPLVGIEPAVASRAGAAAVGVLLGTAVTVSTIVVGAVALDLAADRAAVPAHESSNGRTREARHLFPERGQRIP